MSAHSIEPRQLKTPEHLRLRALWSSMIRRCHRPDTYAYKWYGARGIAVCDSWRESFDAFVQDVGPRPSAEHQLDRIDNDKGYNPENVRWITSKGQNRNRRGNRLVEAFGETLPLAEWAERIGMNYNTLRSRIERGWDIEEMLSRTPTRARRRCQRRRMEGENGKSFRNG